MKILLFRFSSFGDVLQTLSVAGRLGQDFPQAEIHWVTREEFAPLVSSHPHVTKVWTIRHGDSLFDLLRLGRKLKRENFTHIYDAHNNLRSRILGWQLNGFLGWRRLVFGHRFLRRSIYRWRRYLLFHWRRNLFPKPFSGQFALLEPLQKWGLKAESPPVPQLILNKAELRLPAQAFVALAPSSAFALKRWPLEYWKQLIADLPDQQFVVLGGKQDQFLDDLVEVAPLRVTSYVGQLSLMESAQVVAASDALVSNDTGLMHVAEQIGKPCIALMGPAPFGFPSRPRTRILELDLPCRPCSKHGQGPCVNPQFQQCLRGISPARVEQELRGILHA